MEDRPIVPPLMAMACTFYCGISGINSYNTSNRLQKELKSDLNTSDSLLEGELDQEKVNQIFDIYTNVPNSDAQRWKEKMSQFHGAYNPNNNKLIALTIANSKKDFVEFYEQEINQHFYTSVIATLGVIVLAYAFKKLITPLEPQSHPKFSI